MTHAPTPPRLAFTREEACAMLGGISLPTLDKLISSGRLKVVRLKRRVLVPLTSLEDFLLSNS
ncbi:hypothetical protein DAETH_10090 [Deinococcus aetherius]|uniref:Helix-turn-helix domain-containing protein n=1 Tax=Deinococcus aetherius TaxID=200252 RepID=A0ABM8ABS6_9DEIO|nr:helix-turn-helix domain-containing protein [Deinococcus aetherius]BDP41040.1 hypothetical protein DAETH_10090 [Deinococcus aetherius]